MSVGGSGVLMMHSVRDVTEDAVEVLRATYSGPVGAYPDAGYWTRPNWTFVDQVSPEVYLAEFPMTEGPGISVFCKDDSGRVFHTYSSYARGLDMFIGAYHLLDIVPKGRDEDTLDFSMEWIRHYDRYDEAGP